MSRRKLCSPKDQLVVVQGDFVLKEALCLLSGSALLKGILVVPEVQLEEIPTAKGSDRKLSQGAGFTSSLDSKRNHNNRVDQAHWSDS